MRLSCRKADSGGSQCGGCRSGAGEFRSAGSAQWGNFDSRRPQGAGLVRLRAGSVQQLAYPRLRRRGNEGSTSRDHGDDALGKYDLASLVTHEFPLDRIEEAIAFASNPEQAQKVCISFPSH